MNKVKEKKVFDAIPVDTQKLLKRIKKEKLDHLEIFVIVEEEKHYKVKKIAVKHPHAGKPGWGDWIIFEQLPSGMIRKGDSIGCGHISVLGKWEY
jgi:hypothetical protein